MHHWALVISIESSAATSITYEATATTALSDDAKPDYMARIKVPTEAALFLALTLTLQKF